LPANAAESSVTGASFPEKLKESERFERFCKRFAGKMPAFPTYPKLMLIITKKE
jgi:hypothetical protein